MKFTKEALSQASSKYLAEYRTWKMRQQLGGNVNRERLGITYFFMKMIIYSES